MGKTRRQLLRELDELELQEWMVYDRVNPFGQDRDNWHMAILATILSRANGDKRAEVEKFTIDTGPVKEQSLDEIANTIDAFFGAIGVAPSRE